MDFRALNERICSLRIRSTSFNITFITCHAPTEKKEAIIKDNFYGNFERIYVTAHRHESNFV